MLRAATTRCGGGALASQRRGASKGNWKKYDKAPERTSRRRGPGMDASASYMGYTQYPEVDYPPDNPIPSSYPYYTKEEKERCAHGTDIFKDRRTGGGHNLGAWTGAPYGSSDPLAIAQANTDVTPQDREWARQNRKRWHEQEKKDPWLRFWRSWYIFWGAKQGGSGHQYERHDY